MTTKRRMDYRVDEDDLKRMMAGDVTALEETAAPAETPEIKPSLSRERQEKKTSAGSPKQQTRKFPDEASGADEYRLRFLEAKLTGTRRQTYIHDSLNRAVARVLPVIAPDLSVPMFLSSVLSDHLERYQDIINEIYNQEATQKPIEWKK